MTEPLSMDTDVKAAAELLIRQTMVDERGRSIEGLDFGDLDTDDIQLVANAALASAEQLVRLTAALEFYADPELYTPDSPDGLCPAEDDRGERARSALASEPPPR